MINSPRREKGYLELRLLLLWMSFLMSWRRRKAHTTPLLHSITISRINLQLELHLALVFSSFSCRVKPVNSMAEYFKVSTIASRYDKHLLIFFGLIPIVYLFFLTYTRVPPSYSPLSLWCQVTHFPFCVWNCVYDLMLKYGDGHTSNILNHTKKQGDNLLNKFNRGLLSNLQV